MRGRLEELGSFPFWSALYNPTGKVLMGVARWEWEQEELAEAKRTKVAAELKRLQLQLAQAEAAARLQVVQTEMEARSAEIAVPGYLGALAPENIAKPRPAAPFDLTGTWFIDLSKGFADYMFGPVREFDEEYAAKHWKPETSAQMLTLADRLAALAPINFTIESIEGVVRGFAEELGLSAEAKAVLEAVPINPLVKCPSCRAPTSVDRLGSIKQIGLKTIA